MPAAHAASRPPALSWAPLLQEDMYSYVTVADDQSFKGKTTVKVEDS